MKATSLFLDQQRQMADLPADQLVAHFFKREEQAKLYHFLRSSFRDASALPTSPLKKFFFTPRSQPAWYDYKKICRGQLVFKKYALPIMTLLGGLSLPYCYAGSPGNKALYLSDKMRQSPAKRLLDTADFIIAVSKPNSFDENQEGHFNINRTRLIHAIARYHIHQSGSWNKTWGETINQEDMAGTNLAFSYLIILGLQKSAFILTEREKQDFLFLWKYIGYQLHIDEDLLPATFSEASMLERAIRVRHFKKSEEGKILMQELLAYYRSVMPANQANLIDAQIRYWLGPFVADCVGLGAQPVKDKLVQTINAARELANFFEVRNDSYEEMIRNHKLLKKSVEANKIFAR